MADPEYLAILRKGATEWNQWRGRIPGIEPSLLAADLQGAKPRRIDLSDTNLSNADLSWADLSRTDLSRTDLSCDWPGWLRDQIEYYNVLDFSLWGSNDEFESQYQKLKTGLGIYYRK